MPPPFEDRRARFRALFDALNRHHGERFATWQSTEQALHPAPSEGVGLAPVPFLGPARLPLRLLIVPGLGGACFARLTHPLACARTHLATLGYPSELVELEALSSCRRNAALLAAAVQQRDGAEPLVLLGYSKGAVDILEMLDGHPEAARRIAAVVSLSGAISGSSLSRQVPTWLLDLLRFVPGARCVRGDLGALASMRPALRKAWLEAWRPPGGLHVYSILSFAGAERISAILRPGHRRLTRIDPRNDGQMLHDDQIIPGSRLLACLDADHWAVALPIAADHPWLARLLVTRNAFPREILLEAVMRTIEDDLLNDPGSSVRPRRPTGEDA